MLVLVVFLFYEGEIEAQKGKITQDYITKTVAEQSFEPNQTMCSSTSLMKVRVCFILSFKYAFLLYI